MSLPADQRTDEPAAPAPRARSPRRSHVRLSRASLVAIALLAVGVLAAACSGGPASPGVASAGKTATSTGSSTAQGGSSASLEDSALAYVACMRTHGEPDMPDLTMSGSGSGVHISVSAGSGFNPSTPQYPAANKACEHLLARKGGAGGGGTITPAEQADYLEAAACMRSHGVPDFPDPTFEGNSVQFDTSTPLGTSSPRYKGALATCQRLIPTGLPYSATSGS